MQENDREDSFVAAETTVFVPQQHGGQGPPMSRKQRLEAPLCAALEQERDNGALQEEGYKHTVILHAHMEAGGLWLVPAGWANNFMACCSGDSAMDISTQF